MYRLLNLSLAVIIYAVFLVQSAPGRAETVMITGANSGIGLEFARQYSEKGWNVIATHRRDTIPELLAELAGRYNTVRIERMDVTNHGEIDALAKKLAGTPIDVLINNAGVVLLGQLGDPNAAAAQQFGTLDYDQFDIYMHTNVSGPIKIAEAFLGSVRAGQQKKIINISSAAGSLTIPVRYSGMYWYKASKSALNMLMKTLAHQLSEDGITVVMFHPGTVRIEKLENVEFPGMIEPEVSISGMIDVIDNLKLEDSGKFLTHTGEPQPF